MGSLVRGAGTFRKPRGAKTDTPRNRFRESRIFPVTMFLSSSALAAIAFNLLLHCFSRAPARARRFRSALHFFAGRSAGSEIPQVIFHAHVYRLRFTPAAYYEALVVLPYPFEDLTQLRRCGQCRNVVRNLFGSSSFSTMVEVLPPTN